MATTDQKTNTNNRELNSQALALAEQLGRIAGTLEGTAEAWINRASLTDQLTKVRDGAAQLLNTLAEGATIGRRAAAESRKPTARTAMARPDLAHAPGKRHRKPAPSVHGAKKSDARIPKAKMATQARQRRKLMAK